MGKNKGGGETSSLRSCVLFIQQKKRQKKSKSIVLSNDMASLFKVKAFLLVTVHSKRPHRQNLSFFNILECATLETNHVLLVFATSFISIDKKTGARFGPRGCALTFTTC